MKLTGRRRGTTSVVWQTDAMRIDVEDLVGMMEIADRLGVQRQTVRLWRHRGVFPEPLAVVSRTPLWRWRDVDKWAKSRPSLSTRG